MTYKKLTFEMYMSEPASKRFRNLEDNQTLQTVFEGLTRPSSVDGMIAFTKEKRPAMETVIEEIEETYVEKGLLDLEHIYRYRQILGSMIRYIMGHYGYWPGKAKPLKRGRFVKTAIVYYKA